MNTSNLKTARLAEMPLWRLLVLLADVEREFGAACPTARVVTRLVRERLKSDDGSLSPVQKGVARA